MPSSRRMRATGLVAILLVCIIFYITHGAKSTHDSPFYTRTVAAIQDREAKEARQHALTEEIERLERVERLQREHDAAVSEAALKEQKPIVPDTSSKSTSGKSVAGRKMMNDGKVVHGGSSKDTVDGVAKVGNVGPQSSHAVVGEKEESEEERKVQAELNDILKKGPIIIFSKSYCPYSRKAKHILLDLYDISPPPYVVELDQHDLGSGLQGLLATMTGRRTVPNVLINGKSIGGGDDVQELDEDDKLASTVSSMGGKRIMRVQRTPEHEASRKTEVKFKA